MTLDTPPLPLHQSGALVMMMMMMRWRLNKILSEALLFLSHHVCGKAVNIIPSILYAFLFIVFIV